MTEDKAVSLSDEEILENGFWISDKNSKEGIGVKVVPFYGANMDKIESITVQAINHTKNDKVEDEIEIFRNEFGRLIELAELLKKEEKHGGK